MPASYSDRTFIKEAQIGQYGSTAASNVPAAVAAMHQRYGDTMGPSAATTAGTTYRFCGWTTDRAIKIIGVRIQPGGAVAANGTNYVTYALVQNNDAGGADTTIASLNTSATSLSANQSAALALTAANVQVAAGQALQFTITPSGTGVATGANTFLQVLYEEV